MRFYEQLSVGDRVMLTREGAEEYRKRKMAQGTALGAPVGALLLMGATPGAIFAGIGIASAGVGIGVSAAGIGATGAAVGGGAGSLLSNLSRRPEARDVGTIVEKKHRNFRQAGFNYKVKWDLEETGKRPYCTWHTSKYLRRLIGGVSESDFQASI